MATLELKYWPADVLRTKAVPVETFGTELRQLLEDMAETMYAEHGIGLAAPQVGISQRILVMDIPDDERPATLRALVNPEIVEREGEIVWEEGCLSFPGLTADVKRARRIRVRYQDAEGARREMVAEELEAVCIQHEIDHLDGITFIDYVSPLKRRLLLRDLRRTLEEMGVEAA